MRCPKCHYLSFEPESRCRNCGYDFALAAAASGNELSIKPIEQFDSEAGPLADVELRKGPGPRAVAVAVADAPIAAVPAIRPVPLRPPTTTTELPLFVRGLPPPALPGESAANDIPAAALASQPPRPPLAVRRRAPEPAPAPTSPLATPLLGARPASPFSAVASAKPAGSEQGRLLEGAQAEPVWAPMAHLDSAPVADRSSSVAVDRVGPRRRFKAALVDATLLCGIDALIVWFTLRICALTIGQAATLPLLPLAAFCVLLDVGYVLMFTATSGQTVGKMAAGIRVVAAGVDAAAGGYVTIRQAAIRSLLTLPSALVPGAINDRLSQTRIVRA